LRRGAAERFHLQLHTETRLEPMLNLVAAKGGIKIEEADPPVPPDKEGRVNAAVGDRSGRTIANKATMAGLASVLALFLKRPVIDQTGLKGYYDFDASWSAPEAPRRAASRPGFRHRRGCLTVLGIPRASLENPLPAITSNIGRR
jgi:uncharacterized protein (TIGR03435 family)